MFEKETINTIVSYFVANHKWLANPKRERLTNVHFIQNFNNTEEAVVRVHLTALIPTILIGANLSELVDSACQQHEHVEYNKNTGWVTVWTERITK